MQKVDSKKQKQVRSLMGIMKLSGMTNAEIVKRPSHEVAVVAGTSFGGLEMDAAAPGGFPLEDISICERLMA